MPIKTFDYQQACQMKYIYNWLGAKSAQSVDSAIANRTRVRDIKRNTNTIKVAYLYEYMVHLK